MSLSVLVWLSSTHAALRLEHIWLTVLTLGPAHAVYFATYEAVKHLMGGNKAGEHHPLAAGKLHTRTCACVVLVWVAC